MELAGRNHPVEAAGYPDELLESRYGVNRDEILWREYSSYLARGGSDATNNANRVLRVIRETPD